MSEIKSTLDLVMEKTKHLSMSAEEKERQKRTDFEKRLQGIFQHYEDGALSVNAVEEKINELAAEEKILDRRLVIDDVLGRIDFSKDNERWLDLVAKLAPEIYNPLKEALAAYREKEADILLSVERRMLDRLKKDHGIEGSAVVCNPGKDAGYLKDLKALEKETKGKIRKGSLSLDGRGFR
jgi:hypothetical protein